MDYKVVITRPAIKDLSELVSFIRRDNPAAAAKYLAQGEAQRDESEQAALQQPADDDLDRCLGCGTHPAPAVI